MKCCENCKSTNYCSKRCQLSHWSIHSVPCKAISALEELEREKLYKGKSVRQVLVNEGMRRKLIIFLSSIKSRGRESSGVGNGDRVEAGSN